MCPSACEQKQSASEHHGGIHREKHREAAARLDGNRPWEKSHL
jgi:hypothetical protein